MNGLVGSALAVEGPIGIIEGIFAFMALFIFRSESERWPGQFRKWTPYISGNSDHYRGESSITVGVRKRSRKVALTSLDPNAADFDQALADAESFARERCIQLNATSKSITRRLP